MNNYNSAEVAAKVKHLRSLDLSNLSLKDVEYELSNFSLPYNTFLQEPEHYIFRGQVNDSEVPFNSIGRISYNPSPSKYAQRASLPGDIVFYASDGIDIVAHESIQDELRKTKKW